MKTQMIQNTSLSRRRIIGRRRSRASQRGFSVAEGIFGSMIYVVTVLSVMTMMVYSLRRGDVLRTTNRLAMDLNSATDEMLYEVRGGSLVAPSAVVNGATVSTNGSAIVFTAPGYSTTGQSVLTSVSDTITLQVVNGQLQETIVPGAGSSRPSRTNYVLTKNVSSVAFTYKARDQFTAMASGSGTYILSTATSGTPIAYVNGVATSCTYSASSHSVTVSNLPLGADVEVVYPVDATNTSGLAYVSDIDVTLTLSSMDSSRTTRTLSLAGNARMRNRRI